MEENKKKKSKKEIDKEFLYLNISDEGKKIFDWVEKKYAGKIDVELDFAELSIFAESCARLKVCNDFASKNVLFYQTANGNFTAHPVRDEISMLQKQIHTSSSKLGLSPVDRCKIKSTGKTGRAQKGSSFLETLRNFNTE